MYPWIWILQASCKNIQKSEVCVYVAKWRTMARSLFLVFLNMFENKQSVLLTVPRFLVPSVPSLNSPTSVVVRVTISCAGLRMNFPHLSLHSCYDHCCITCWLICRWPWCWQLSFFSSLASSCWISESSLCFSSWPLIEFERGRFCCFENKR